MNRRPLLAEFRSLGVLAVPIIITQLAQMGMGVADAIMAGRVSATDLAGIALGGNLYWPLMLLMSGIVMAVTPSVSQLHGAGLIADAGAVVRQALWIAVCGGAMVAALLQYVEPAYRLLGVHERAIPRCLASAPSSPNLRVSAALPWNKRVRGATALDWDGYSMVDERGRAAGGAEGDACGALAFFGLDGTQATVQAVFAISRVRLRGQP